MENPLFVMSLSGTLSFLLYIALYPLARKFFRSKWRYILLKVILAFYLIPIPLLLNWIWQIIRDFIQANHDAANVMTSVDNFVETIVISTYSVASLPYVTALLYVSVFLGVISLVMLCFQIFNYIREKRICLHSGYELPQDKFQEEADTIHFHSNVKFMASPKAKTPFAIGVWKPVIILPVEMLDADRAAISVCIRHELMHIKNKDLIYRLLALTAVCVHWFNPICHRFRNELIIVSEICCDHEVLRTMQKPQRKLYYHALISVTESLQPKLRNEFLSSFADENRRELKRRILELEVIDTPKRELFAVLSCAAVLFIGIVSALTYAPSPIQTNLNLNFNNSLTVFDPDTLPPAQADLEQGAKNELTIYDPNASSADDFRLPLPFVCYFADENGTVYEANLDFEDQSCTHEFVSGTIVEHIKTSERECMMAYYQGKRCVNCGFQAQGDCVMQKTTTECNHVFINAGGGE